MGARRRGHRRWGAAVRTVAPLLRHRDGRTMKQTGPRGEAKPDLMESLSLPPPPADSRGGGGGLLRYASQRLPAVLIGAGLRQSISPCPSLWEKQWEIKNTQLGGGGLGGVGG